MVFAGSVEGGDVECAVPAFATDDPGVEGGVLGKSRGVKGMAGVNMFQ
jgi:hypothetical protein